MNQPFAARLAELQLQASAEPWVIEQRLGDVAEYVLMQAPRAAGLPTYELGVIGGYFDGPEPVDGLPDADLIVYLRNHTDAILALVEAATERVHFDKLRKVHDLDHLAAALEALNRG